MKVKELKNEMIQWSYYEKVKWNMVVDPMYEYDMDGHGMEE